MGRNSDILLINRDKYFLKQTASVIQEAGHTVHTAMEMRGALSILSSHPIGLIICDKALEDISGIDFLSFIKKDPLRENIPIMFFVSLNDQGRPLKFFEMGAIDYLVYPVDPAFLCARIAEALGVAPPAREQVQAEPSPKPAGDTRDQQAGSTPEKMAVSGMIIDVSRDGVIWMPGNVKTVSSRGLTVETALFGKTGVALMLRFKHPEGTFVVNGRIKGITFDDFQKPTEMEIEAQSDESWDRLHAMLNRSAQDKDGAPAATIQPEQPSASTTVAPSAAVNDENPEISCTTLLQKKQKSAGYDLRFYQSLIGKQLDNYRAITFIGAGNMGGVLQGWDVALEREVALKIISYELSSKEKFREMFIKEARVVSRLNHPNIAHIYHIGSQNDILYYAMEYIEGTTLKEIIQNSGPLTPLKGLDYLITVCRAFETVFQNGIVHRDIKPANIMVSNSGNLKIVDFGVAKNIDLKEKGTDKKTIIGSPWYMSPEQIARLAIDHRSDMYSVGATFYHALSGAPPFNSEKIKEVLHQHLKSPIPPLWKKTPAISSAFSKIIEKMMAKDPGHRYNRFDDIVNELKKLRPRMAQLVSNRPAADDQSGTEKKPQ